MLMHKTHKDHFLLIFVPIFLPQVVTNIIYYFYILKIKKMWCYNSTLDYVICNINNSICHIIKHKIASKPQISQEGNTMKHLTYIFKLCFETNEVTKHLPSLTFFLLYLPFEFQAFL